MENQLQFLKYNTPQENAKIDVVVKNETIWLTQKAMATLFGVQIPAINKHLKNIFEQGELLEKVTISKMEIITQHGAIPDKTKNIETNFYNLDAIISVGYRVNSARATQFRVWATQVLKDYLLKGYAINARIDSVEHRVSKLEFQNHEINKVIQKALPLEQGIFYDGQIFDAYAFVSDLIKSAKKSIILIDNYVDESVLLLLSKRNKNVSAKILTSNFSQVLKQDLSKHNTQYAPIKIEKFTKSHDRFLFIDSDIYHIGASLKDLGKKWFAFSKMGLSPL